MTLLGEFVEKGDCLIYKTSITEGDLYGMAFHDDESETAEKVIEAAEEKYDGEFYLESGEEKGDDGNYELFLCPC